MEPTARIPRAWIRRLSRAAVAAAFLAYVAQGAACGGKVVVDGSELGGGGAGGDGVGGDPSTGAAPSGGITGSTGTSGCTLSTTGASTGTGVIHIQVTTCFPPPSGTKKCPSQLQATQYILPQTKCSAISSVDCGPVPSNGSCCYVVTEELVGCGD